MQTIRFATVPVQKVKWRVSEIVSAIPLLLNVLMGVKVKPQKLYFRGVASCHLVKVVGDNMKQKFEVS